LKYADRPTYVSDLAGDISRVDERDIVFARQDLFRYFSERSQAFKKYYHRHPENLKFDQKMNRKPPLGSCDPEYAPLFRSQFEMMDSIGTERMVDGEPAREKIRLSPVAASRIIKAAAQHFGADKVTIGPLRQEWTYSHVGCTIGNREGYAKWGTPIDMSRHQSAVSMGFRMDLSLLASAPQFPTLLATASAYAKSAWAAVRLAQAIRMMGWSARAHHFSNYRVLCVPVAVDSGMGELSRAGYLLTREFGLGLRLSAVTTDIPLDYDRPVDIAVQSFCEQCRICADDCPSGAIPKGDKILHNGVMKWKLDEQKCYAYWHVNGTDCGICMAVCPWTKPPTPFHRFNALLASYKGPHQRFMAWAERAVYGRHKPALPPEFLA